MFLNTCTRFCDVTLNIANENEKRRAEMTTVLNIIIVYLLVARILCDVKCCLGNLFILSSFRVLFYSCWWYFVDFWYHIPNRKVQIPNRPISNQTYLVLFYFRPLSFEKKYVNWKNCQSLFLNTCPTKNNMLV